MPLLDKAAAKEQTKAVIFFWNTSCILYYEFIEPLKENHSILFLIKSYMYYGVEFIKGKRPREKSKANKLNFLCNMC